jgi:cysteine desulfurase / selenocysteine lyase
VTAHEREITAYALERLGDVSDLRIFGPPSSPDRLGPVSFELAGVHAHDVAEILDRHGVAVRAGHHCAQPVMRHFGIPATLRASFAFYNTTGEVEALARGLGRVREVFA